MEILHDGTHKEYRTFTSWFQDALLVLAHILASIVNDSVSTQISDINFSVERSPAIVIAYLMKCKGWRLAQSYQWVKERRPSVELTEG